MLFVKQGVLCLHNNQNSPKITVSNRLRRVVLILQKMPMRCVEGAGERVLYNILELKQRIIILACDHG